MSLSAMCTQLTAQHPVVQGGKLSHKDILAKLIRRYAMGRHTASSSCSSSSGRTGYAYSFDAT
jgi:hypothetical protein